MSFDPGTEAVEKVSFWAVDGATRTESGKFVGWAIGPG